MRKLDSRTIPVRSLLSLVCIVFAMGCASSGGQRPRAAKTAGNAATPAPAAPHFPNEDLSAKYQAAKRAPKDFDVVMLYASTLAQFCLASMTDTDCGSDCATDAAKHKPAAALADDTRRLAEGALPMLDRLMTLPDLSWEQIARWAVLKGRLLALSGRTAAEQTLIDDYALQHPDAVPVIRRRLELLRPAGDRKAIEAQCNDSRAALKQAPEEARLELLTSCVSLHPANSEGRTDPLDFAKYLPKMTKDEQLLYRQHMAKQCEQTPTGKDAKARLKFCRKLQAR